MPIKVEEMIELAERLIEDHAAFDEASTVLGWATELAESAHAFTALALCHLKSGRGEQALECARRAVELNEFDPQAQNALGVSCADQFLDSEAVRAFARAIELDPTSFAPYFNRGIAAFRLGRYAEAAADLARALLVEGQSLPHRLKYTSMNVELLTADGIFKQLRKFRQDSGPEHEDAFAVLAVLQKFIEGKSPVRAAWLKGMKETGPLGWTAPALRFLTTCHSGAWDEKKAALPLLDGLLEAAPKDSALRWARANAMLALHEDPRLLEDLRFLRRHHPACAEVRDRLIQCYEVRGMLEEADQENERALADDPESYHNLRHRAWIRYRQERYDDAVAAWDRLVDLYALDSPEGVDEEEDAEDELEDSADLYLSRAEALAAADRPEDAEADFARALRFQEAVTVDSRFGPRLDLVRVFRSRFYAKQERLQEALADLDECLRNEPETDHLYMERAALRAKAGDAAGAEADRRKAVELQAAREERARKAKEEQERKAAEGKKQKKGH